MLVESWLARAARIRPDRVAVRAADGAFTYAELDRAAAAAARGLEAAGVRPGDLVGLAMPARLGFAVALHAILRRGAVAVPVDLRLSADERAMRTRGCVVVLDEVPSGRAGTAAIAGEHDLDAPAVVIHTSGTMSDPRPVALTYRNWLFSALGSGVALGVDPQERWLCALPLAHVGGLSILLRSAIYATTAVLHERFDAPAAAEELMAGATLVSVVPTTLARLLDAGLERPPALRAALVGGAPIPAALLERAAAAGVRTATTYGLTEACSQVATQGVPLFCTRVRIEAGEILVAGPTVAPGAAAVDGWLRTGDLGALEPDGTLCVTGRAADTIITGGENVAPAEVEAVLGAHPDVADVGVHGVPDPEWGECVVATIVLHDGATATEAVLRRYCRVRLASYKVPKRITFVAALPRTASGKLLRRALED